MFKTKLRKIKWWGTRNMTKIYSLFHGVQKKVLFESFAGKQYSDNPRAISEKLHELFPTFEIVWSIENQNVREALPGYIKTCARTNRSFFKELATSFCYVTNEDLGPEMYKRKDQFFIQTWHGDRPLKKVLYDTEGFNQYVADKDITDICIAGSDAGERQFRSAFKFNGEVLRVGTPRNDRLVEDNIEYAFTIRQILGIDKETKVLLFAPTFRDVQKTKQDVNVDLDTTLAHLSQNGERWICLVRAHSASMGLKINCDNIKYYDVTTYPDMTDLMCIADMLITDYSSCAGDFLVRRKPVILAIFDKEYYSQNCRGFAYDIEKTGFLIANNQEDLNRIIDTFSENDYRKNCVEVENFFGVFESGKASRDICIRIKDEYEKRQE